MGWLILFWVLIAGVAEHGLALTPATIQNRWKRILYYLVVGPEIALSGIKTLIGRLAGLQLLYVANWFRQ